MNWPVVALGEVATIERDGVDPKRSSATRYVGLEDISSDGRVAPSSLDPTELASTKFRFDERQILFGKLRPYLRKIARPAFSGVCSTDIIPIQPSSKVDRDYLFHFLRTDHVVRRATSLATGANLPRLSPGVLAKFEIPLPPLDEQRRIAAILDQADTLRRKRRAALDKLARLPQVLLGEAVSAADDHSWPTMRLVEVAEALDRYRRPIKASDRAEGIVPYYGANGQQGWIDRALFNESLVLVAEDGGHFGEPERGVAYRIDGPSWVNNHAHILRPRAGIMTVGFLHLILKNYDFSRYISGSTRSKLTLGQLERAEIVCPAMSVQQCIDAKVAQITEQQKLAEDQSIGFDALFASLQHRAFTGQLTRSDERLLETA